MSSEMEQGGLKALRIQLLELEEELRKLEDQLRIAITGEENE
jgi:hypothetical protein